MRAVAGAGAVAGGAAGRGAGGVVSRPRLLGRLAARARVSVVSAPAGSGKTVLLLTDQWRLTDEVLAAERPRRLSCILDDPPGSPSVYVTAHLAV